MKDELTVWTVVLSAAAMFAGLFAAWWMLRRTRDATDVGIRLKWQKLATAVASLANALYWGTVLVAYYTGYMVTSWQRDALLVLFAGGMASGALFVWLFVWSLRRELRRGDSVTLVEVGEGTMRQRGHGRAYLVAVGVVVMVTLLLIGVTTWIW